MIHSCKKTRKINSFELKIIPTIRDLFYKYGNLSGGTFSCGSGEKCDPIMPNSSSVIDQMIYAQKVIDSNTLYEEHKDKL